VVGILAAVFVSMRIQRMGDEAWNVSTGWRWMFFAGIVPAILFGSMILRSRKSPLASETGRREWAAVVLGKINGAEAASHELKSKIRSSRKKATFRNFSPRSDTRCFWEIMDGRKAIYSVNSSNYNMVLSF
jgi:MFS transporter, SP family, arabinose:H+ symporter